MASLRYEVTENEEELYGLFRSPALLDGKKVSVGVAESSQFKKSAVIRGYVDESGEPLPWIGWKESLVMILRDMTTPAPYNHEWWAQHVSKPDWLTQLEKTVMKLWIHYPEPTEFADAKELGSRLGYELTLLERKCGEATSSISFLERWEDVEFKSELSAMPPASSDRTEVVFMGAKSFSAYVSAELKSTQELRKFAIAQSQEGGLSDSQDFLSGYKLGSDRANKACDDDLYWQFFERQAVAETLQGYWTSVEGMATLTEVTAFVRSHLPTETKVYLDKVPEADASFGDRMKKLYQKIGLRKGSAGRPRK